MVLKFVEPARVAQKALWSIIRKPVFGDFQCSATGFKRIVESSSAVRRLEVYTCRIH